MTSPTEGPGSVHSDTSNWSPSNQTSLAVPHSPPCWSGGWERRDLLSCWSHQAGSSSCLANTTGFYISSLFWDTSPANRNTSLYSLPFLFWVEFTSCSTATISHPLTTEYFSIWRKSKTGSKWICTISWWFFLLFWKSHSSKSLQSIRHLPFFIFSEVFTTSLQEPHHPSAWPSPCHHVRTIVFFSETLGKLPSRILCYRSDKCNPGAVERVSATCHVVTKKHKQVYSLSSLCALYQAPGIYPELSLELLHILHHSRTVTRAVQNSFAQRKCILILRIK